MKLSLQRAIGLHGSIELELDYNNSTLNGLSLLPWTKQFIVDRNDFNKITSKKLKVISSLEVKNGLLD